MALGVLEHLEQHPELDSVGMRLDLAWRRRELVVRPGILLRVSLRREVRQLDVRIGNNGLLDVLVDRGPPLLVTALDFHGHLGSTLGLPRDLLLLQNLRLVLLGIDLDLEVMGGRSRTGAGDDLDGLAGRELSIHAGRRDADALLSSAHAQPMELGPVQELREDRRNLLADDAGPVVGDRNPEAARLARRGRSLPIGDGLHLDDHVGEDPGFLAGVKRVIDGLLHTGEQRLSRIVEPQQMPVLGEELGDGDLPLARPHLDGGHRRLRLRGDRTGLRRMELPAARWHGLCSTIPHIPFIQAESATRTQVFPLTTTWAQVHWDEKALGRCPISRHSSCSCARSWQPRNRWRSTRRAVRQRWHGSSGYGARWTTPSARARSSRSAWPG